MADRARHTALFDYFDAQLGHPDWSGKAVLDFGGGSGALLAGAAGRIDPHRYWCLDVSREALRAGRASHPDAHWIRYDRYNPEFNSRGTRNLPLPDLGADFDYILAYSVFTHTDEAEMLELVDQLERVLRPGGVLAFTFIDPHWTPAFATGVPGCNLHWRIARITLLDGVDVAEDFDPAKLLEQARQASSCRLVNADELYLDGEPEPRRRSGTWVAYQSFYTASRIRHLFPDARVLSPVPPHRQHCCVMTN